MIHISITYNDQQEIQEVELFGHAGYAEYGQDIVCAAVSSQVISVEHSLEQLLHIQPELEVDEQEGGYLRMALPILANDSLKHDAQLLLNHLRYALSTIAEHYPEFVKIHIKK